MDEIEMKEDFVEKILKAMFKKREKHVAVYHSAVELDYNDEGYEFLYDYAMAVLEERKGE